MEEFLNTIYSYEYFGFYLILAIIVLVILFLMILFFGKKDQKNREIEATKKLEQINADAFKEEDMKEPLELSDVENKTFDDTIVVPNVNEMPTLNYVEEAEEIPEPILPIMENISEVKEENTNVYEPILEKVEEKPLVFDNTNVLNVVEDIKENSSEETIVVPKVEETIKEESPAFVPNFDFESIMKDIEEVKVEEKLVNNEPVFSSVYAPKKEEVDVQEEIPVARAMEDLEFELPSLRKEKVEDTKVNEIEVPILKDYNLDELSGETYNINK